tara:strand:- start:30963 stop:31172 length:210 start_codon:yes stop_codon:yes gene_type:complete
VKRIFRIFIAISMLPCLYRDAIAHPGHGVDDVTHYAVEPAHQVQFGAWMAVTFLASLLLVAAWYRKTSQ